MPSVNRPSETSDSVAAAWAAHGGTGHAGGQFDALGLRGDGAQHGPGERGVALDVEPWVVVVADLDEVEAGAFGQHGLADELLRSERLGGELVADLHACAVPSIPVPGTASRGSGGQTGQPAGSIGPSITSARR
jgi:hypothetical protein